MKTPRLTRDQAIAKIAELENELTIRKESSQTMREELSKALGAGTYKENTYSTPEQVVYSWYKIMLELGKVLARKDHANFTDQVRELGFRVDRLEHDEVPFPQS